MTVGGKPVDEPVRAQQRRGAGNAREVKSKLVAGEQLDGRRKFALHDRILRRYTAAVLGATLFLVAAVLTNDSVVFVDTTTAAVLRAVTLPAPAVTLFAAPDGRVLLPLAGSDETAVVSPVGPTERWPGRVFPVFYDEIDRMHVVFPDLLLVMSYPERLPILRVPVTGVPAPWRAACSRNGLLVAICPPPGERRLVLAISEPGAQQSAVALAGEPRSLVATESGAWVAVGFDDGVEVVFPGEPRGRGRLAVRPDVRSLAVAGDGRDLLVGFGTGDRGGVVTLRVSPKVAAGARERGELLLSGAVSSIAVAAEEVVVVAGETLVVLGKKGRQVKHVLPLQAARQVALLPARPESAAPLWSEQPSR